MRLSAACKQAGIGVPINAIFKRRRTIWDPPPSLPEPTPEERKKLEKEVTAGVMNVQTNDLFLLPGNFILTQYPRGYLGARQTVQ